MGFAGRGVEINTEECTSVMDAIFQVLTVFNRTPDLVLDKAVVATIHDGIVPCLRFYMTLHFVELFPHNREKLVSSKLAS
jgi:hypothetical protein